MRRWWPILLPAVVVACAATPQEPSSLVQPVASVPERAPPDRALVVFHRPARRSGQRFSTSLWDGPAFVADLRSGHGCYRICEPGRHHFVSRSDGWVAVVEADLLPGRAYDIILELHAGWNTMDAYVTPVTKDDGRRSDIPELLAETRYFEPKPNVYVRDYETAQRPETLRIIEEFTTGEKQERLQRLEADDYR